MKIMIIEATAEDLQASRSLKDAFNGLLQTLFDGSVQTEPKQEDVTMPPMGAKVTNPEKPKPAKKTDKVDWPKAKALRDAGWSYDKIGDELGISGVTVSAHLKEMEK